MSLNLSILIVSDIEWTVLKMICTGVRIHLKKHRKVFQNILFFWQKGMVFKAYCSRFILRVWVFGIRPIVRKWALSLLGECSPLGVFVRPPRPYLREFQRKQLKTPKDRSTSAIGDRTRHLPSTSLELRTSQLLAGRDLNCTKYK